MNLKGLALVALVAVALVGCKEDDPQDNNNGNSGASNEMVFNNAKYNLTGAEIENYGSLDTLNWVNLDLTLHNNANSEVASQIAYFEINTTDSTKLIAGTYNFDQNWGANSFDLGVFGLIAGTDTSIYFATDGSLVVTSNSSTSVACTFTCNVVNQADPLDNGTITGSYDGSAVFFAIKAEENDVKGVSLN